MSGVASNFARVWRARPCKTRLAIFNAAVAQFKLGPPRRRPWPGRDGRFFFVFVADGGGVGSVSLALRVRVARLPLSNQ